MSKLTIGVWGYRRATNTPVPVFHIFAKGKHGCIAQVQGDREGDARLIAAAPDMFAALQRARDVAVFAEDAERSVGDRFAAQGFGSLLAQIDAAIAKAGGARNG